MVVADTSKQQQQQPAAYRLVAGDELGVLRVIEVPAGPKWEAAAVVSQWGSADKSHAVQALACSAASVAPGTPALLAVGRKGGRVEILDAHTGTQQCSLTAIAPPPAAAAGRAKSSSSSSSSSTAVVALEFVHGSGSRPLQLVVGVSDGTVSLCSCCSAGASSNDGSSSSSWIVDKQFSVGQTLSCLAVDAAGSHLVVGGEGMQPSIWCLSTGSKVWQGKGGKPNRIGLVDKPFTTALAFLPSGEGAAAAAAEQQQAAGASGQGAEGSSMSSISRRFLAGSATAKLHVYDTAAGKRPQQEAVFGESRITALAVEPDGQRVWAASGTGHMQLLVLKTNKLLDALKGAGGSVRTLALYPGPQPLVASAGLDRFVRVHDLSTRANKGRVYLKQQLTSVVWLPVQLPAGTAAGAAAAAAAADAEGEQVPAAAAVGSSRKKKKKSRSRGHEDGDDAAAAGGDDDGAAGGGVAAEKKRSKRRKQQAAS